MALAVSMIAAIALFGTLGKIDAGLSFPENNPDLGVYQNEADCFPMSDSWYFMYRSFEYDHFFGRNLTCVVVTPSGFSENGAGHFAVDVGGTPGLNITVRLMSSPGYDVPNIINVVADGAPETNFNMTIVYRYCDSCQVFRHSYADGGKGCSLWQTKSALSQNATCCDYVYDLVCGTSTKYHMCDKGV